MRELKDELDEKDSELELEEGQKAYLMNQINELKEVVKRSQMTEIDRQMKEKDDQFRSLLDRYKALFVDH
jgi:type 1 glutamine amidotransferase